MKTKIIKKRNELINSLDPTKKKCRICNKFKDKNKFFSLSLYRGVYGIKQLMIDVTKIINKGMNFNFSTCKRCLYTNKQKIQ